MEFKASGYGCLHQTVTENINYTINKAFKQFELEFNHATQIYVNDILFQISDQYILRFEDITINKIRFTQPVEITITYEI